MKGHGNKEIKEEEGKAKTGEWVETKCREDSLTRNIFS